MAQWMSVFLRRCDVLDIACLAQIVNTISPLLTTNDQLLRQTTFYPFVLFSNHAAGQSLAAADQLRRSRTPSCSARCRCWMFRPATIRPMTVGQCLL